MPGAATLATKVPAVGDAGGVAPAARRIITPAKFDPVGFTHDSETAVFVTLVAFSEVTGPGAVTAFLPEAGVGMGSPRMTVAPRVDPRTCACPGAVADTATVCLTVAGTCAAVQVAPASVVMTIAARWLVVLPVATQNLAVLHDTAARDLTPAGSVFRTQLAPPSRVTTALPCLAAVFPTATHFSADTQVRDSMDLMPGGTGLAAQAVPPLAVVKTAGLPPAALPATMQRPADEHETAPRDSSLAGAAFAAQLEPPVVVVTMTPLDGPDALAWS